MKKIVLLQGAIAIILVFSVFGILFFRREGTDTTNDKSASTTKTAQTDVKDTTTGSTMPPTTANQTATPDATAAGKEGEVAFLENFVASYNTFIYGNFLNIMNLYPSMTNQFKAVESARIAKLEASMSGGTPPRTVISRVKNSTEISYDPDSLQLILKVEIEKSTYGGAYTKDQDSGVVTNGGDSPLLNENGDVYEGKLDELLKSKEVQAYRIVGIKKGGEWMVSDLQKIN
jgi:hypothetical protein